MATFSVTYADGTTKTEVQSDCETVEQFLNCRFGSVDTSSIKVSIEGEEVPSPKKTTKK